MDLKIIKKNNWTKILTRPFSLFGASIWDEWYSSEQTKEVFGVSASKGLFIEWPKGMVRHYRDKSEIEILKEFIKNDLATNPKKYEALLEEGTRINKTAKNFLKSVPFNSAKEAVNFLTKLALLSTILPYVIGELISTKQIIKKMTLFTTMLRGISLYPKVIKKIVEPVVNKELMRLGVSDEKAFGLITYQELLKGETKLLDKRLLEVKQNRTFIYQNIKGKEDILWVQNPEKIINEIESSYNLKVSKLKGNIAYKGKVEGKVKIVLTNDLGKIKFDKGDILVATSTNPTLAPLFKKAVAIVTDEGGIMSHAAILSREMKIPCIIGAQIATKVLKDGDLVEVDANKGVVKKI